MSTRCQMAVYKNANSKIRNGDVFIYRYSDGYPGNEDGSEYGVLSVIVPFLRQFNKARGIDDGEYCTARLLQYLCNESDAVINGINMELGRENGMHTTGYGVDTALHADIEYFYHISPEKVQVFECRLGDTGAEIGKKVHEVLLED